MHGEGVSCWARHQVVQRLRLSGTVRQRPIDRSGTSFSPPGSALTPIPKCFSGREFGSDFRRPPPLINAFGVRFWLSKDGRCSPNDSEASHGSCTHDPVSLAGKPWPGGCDLFSHAGGNLDDPLDLSPLQAVAQFGAFCGYASPYQGDFFTNYIGRSRGQLWLLVLGSGRLP